MDKKITFFAKLGLILIVIGSIFRMFNEPFGWVIFVCSTIVILPIFFVFNLIRELKEEEETKVSVFIYFLGAISFLFGLGFRILRYDFGINFFLISMGLFSFLLLINGLEKIKENKKNIFPYIVYPFVFFLVIIAFKFYLLPSSFDKVWIHLSLSLVFIFALISYVILLVNLIKKTEFIISKYNQLKIVVLLTTLIFSIFVRYYNSIPSRTQDVNEINLAQIQQENENQVVLGNSLITDKSKLLVSKLDVETQKVIKKLDSIKVVLLSMNDKEFKQKMKNGEVKSIYTSGEKLIPFSIKISDIMNPKNTIELSGYDYPYEIAIEYRKNMIKALFPKITDLGNFNYDFEYIDDALDLKSKIIRICKKNNLTEDEQKLMLLILMKDTHKGYVDYYDIHYDYKRWSFEFLTITSAVEKITKLQNDILSTRTLIISHI